MAATDDNELRQVARHDERLITLEREMGEVRRGVKDLNDACQKLQVANAVNTKQVIMFVVIMVLSSGGGSLLAQFIQVAK